MAYTNRLFLCAVLIASIQAKTFIKESTPSLMTSTNLDNLIGSDRDGSEAKNVILNRSLVNSFRIIQVPRRYFERSTLIVHVECANESVFAAEVVVSTQSQTNVAAFRKTILCAGHFSSVQNIHLKLPRYIAYKPSRLNKYSVYVLSASLRCWFLQRRVYDVLKSGKSKNYYESSDLRFQSPLKLAEPYDRPSMPSFNCYDWLNEIISKLPYTPKCDKESEVVRAITFPVALSGFAHGVHRVCDPFRNLNLRTSQLQARGKPNFSFTIWLYIEDYCPFQKPYCSILQHITWDDKFATPQISIDHKGRVGLELITENGTSIFELSSSNEIIPKYIWSMLLLSCQPHQCNFSVSQGFPLKLQWMRSISIDRSKVLYFDDTMGIMVYGGSELSSSFKGYIGKASFNRRKAIRPEEAEGLGNEDAAVKLQLNKKHSKCMRYTKHIHMLMERQRCLITKAFKQVTCPVKHPFHYANEISCPADSSECIQFPKQKCSLYKYVYDLVREYSYRGWFSQYKEIADEIYLYAEELLDTQGADSVELVISLLKQSSCLGNHDASFMLSVILNYGLTVKSVEIEPHSYLMYGALEGNRLCLLSLGNKHVYALDGFTQDNEQAYVYFKPVADMTNKDFRIHNMHDVYTEMVRLTNDLEVREQTEEDGDITQYLKMQANQGVLLAQKRLARMYYWGSGGLTRNIEMAFKYYRMAANSGDPSSLYDYGIVLLKGHGTKKNFELAVEVLEKSANQGFVQALNSLGWVAMEIEKNFSKAAAYFHRSHDLGNKDASFNLAHMFLKGKYPNSTVDRVRAWEYIAAGALRGQYEAGILVGMYNMRGHPKIRRNTELAVGWTRYVAEQNPGIGRLLHKGLRSYKEKNWFLALVYYLMSASTGVEVANFNLAYLCDEDNGGFVKLLDKECKWRHYNLSIQRAPKDVDPYAWNKMAHYYYYHGLNGRQDKQEAVRLYFNAAIKGDPQGLYNLAMLIKEGVNVSEYYLNSLLVPVDLQSDKFYLMGHLLMRCQEAKSSEAYLPCTFALYEMLLNRIWFSVSFYLETPTTLVAIVVLTTLACGLLLQRTN